MKGIRIPMTLSGKSELAATPGQILLQFGTLPGATGLPFHLHLPAETASQLVVGNSYTLTLQEAK